jgi:hypothetical protein
MQSARATRLLKSTGATVTANAGVSQHMSSAATRRKLDHRFVFIVTINLRLVRASLTLGRTGRAPSQK